MRRGWIRLSPRHPLKVQRAALEAAGVKSDAIYEADRKGEVTIDVFVKSLRKGDVVVVAGADRLAESWSGMLTALQKIAARGCRILDANTGYETDAGAALVIGRARSVYSGEARIPDTKTARERASKSSRGRRELTNEHKRMWRDIVKFKTNADAAAAISADLGRLVSPATLRRHFKGSGRMAGWYKPED